MDVFQFFVYPSQFFLVSRRQTGFIFVDPDSEKLVGNEFFCLITKSLLLEDHWSGRFELYKESRNQQHWREDDQNRSSNQNIQQPF